MYQFTANGINLRNRRTTGSSDELGFDAARFTCSVETNASSNASTHLGKKTARRRSMVQLFQGARQMLG